MKVLRGIFVLFLFGFLLAGILILLFHGLFLRSFAEENLAAQLGTRVTIGGIETDLANTHIKFKNVQVLNPQGFPEGPLATIPYIFLDFEIRSLDERIIHFDTVEIDCKDVHIVKNAAGEYNWFALSPFSSQSTDPGIRSAGWPLQIDHYELSLGQVSYTDYSTTVPFRRVLPIRQEGRSYAGLDRFKDLIRVIAWETLLVIDASELRDAFRQVEVRVEEKLDSREEFLKRFH